MNTAQSLRNNALDSVSEHNVRWKVRAMQELRWMRNRAKNTKTAGQLFTFEDILPDLVYLIGSDIPNFQLAGSIMLDGIKRGFFEQTGVWKQTKGDKKHSRKAAEYRWLAK